MISKFPLKHLILSGGMIKATWLSFWVTLLLGYFHERVSETPVHWLPTGVGPTQKPFSVFENGLPELKCDIVVFMTCLISYFIHTKYNGA